MRTGHPSQRISTQTRRRFQKYSSAFAFSFFKSRSIFKNPFSGWLIFISAFNASKINNVLAQKFGLEHVLENMVLLSPFLVFSQYVSPSLFVVCCGFNEAWERRRAQENTQTYFIYLFDQHCEWEESSLTAFRSHPRWGNPGRPVAATTTYLFPDRQWLTNLERNNRNPAAHTQALLVFTGWKWCWCLV